jgi:O-antigen/teichoic acid export membrane protein
LYRPEYAGAARTFTWVMVAATVAYAATFLNTAMVILRATKAQVCLFLIVAATGYTLCALLVPKYGLTGAAWAVGATYVIQLLGATMIVANIIRRWHAEPSGSGGLT